MIRNFYTKMKTLAFWENVSADQVDWEFTGSECFYKESAIT